MRNCFPVFNFNFNLRLYPLEDDMLSMHRATEADFLDEADVPSQDLENM